MYLQSRNAETQFGPRDLDWETVYLLRDQNWFALRGFPRNARWGEPRSTGVLNK